MNIIGEEKTNKSTVYTMMAWLPNGTLLIDRFPTKEDALWAAEEVKKLWEKAAEEKYANHN
jgi:hypothetical protein